MSLAYLDPERQRKARDFARKKRWLFVIDAGVTIAFLVVLMVSGLSFALEEALAFPMAARVALYAAILIAGYSLVLFPLELHEDYFLPRRYGLLAQGLGDWLRDKMRSTFLELLLGVAMLVALYWVMGRFPASWWLLASLLVMLLTVLATDLAPVVFIPLFFKMRPLADEGLRERLIRMVERAKVRAFGVYTMESGRRGPGANAGLMGLGSTRRIVITDTMVSACSPEEIEAVVAHELGHHRHGDILRLMAVQSALVLIGFYLLHLVLDLMAPVLKYAGPADAGAFPLLALFAFLYVLLVSPLMNAYSRRLERDADRYALRLTDNPGAFASVMARLTDQYLADADPAKWVEILSYDHPSYHRRLAAAESYLSEKGTRLA